MHVGEDLTGQKFGKLTVLGLADKRNKKEKIRVLKGEITRAYMFWSCKCDCGGIIDSTSNRLIYGKTKDCGCISRVNGIGQKFGRLTAIKPTDMRSHKYVIWEFKCDCGNLKYSTYHSVKNGLTKSCGCLHSEVSKTNIKIAHTISSKKKAYNSRGMIDGTSISSLKSHINKNNTSDAKGVSWNKRTSKWIAYITFKGKRFHLGYYSCFQHAVDARKTAEDAMFGSFLEWYEKFKIKSKFNDVPSV